MKDLVSVLVQNCGLRPSKIEAGEAIYSDGIIRHTLRVAKDKYDKEIFGWTVVAEDEDFRGVMRDFGGIGVEIRRPASEKRFGKARLHYGYPWPTSKNTIEPLILEDVSRYAPNALSFVADRRDLGELLLSAVPVHRGAVWAELVPGNEAARLAKALILARHVGDVKLEAAVFSKLNRVGEKDISRIPEKSYLFRQSAADWAKEYATVVAVDLSDLIRLKTKPVGQH